MMTYLKIVTKKEPSVIESEKEELTRRAQEVARMKLDCKHKRAIPIDDAQARDSVIFMRCLDCGAVLG